MDVPLIDFSPQLHLPAWWPGKVALFVGLLAVAFYLYRRRHGWKYLRPAARRGFWLLLVLVVVVNVTSAFSLPVDNSLIKTGRGGPTEITLLSYAPIVLAAGWWGGGSAMVLALVGGLANALWKGPHLFILLEWVLLAGIISFLLRQDYTGGLPAVLRRPLPAALVAAIIVWPLQLASPFLDMGPEAFFDSLDRTIVIWFGSGIPLFGALLVAGSLGEIALRIRPTRWFRKTPRRLPPYAANLNSQLLFALLPMAVVGIGVLFWANTRIASSVAADLVVNLMERDAEHVAEIIPSFISTGERLALDLSQDARLQSGDPTALEEHLKQGIHSVPYFSQLVFFRKINGKMMLIAGFPEKDPTVMGMTDAEFDALKNGGLGYPSHEVVFPERMDGLVGPAVVSFVSPVTDPDTGAAVGALLGRTDISDTLTSSPLMRSAIDSLQGLLVGSGMGFITDGHGRILYHPDVTQLEQPWRPAPACTRHGGAGLSEEKRA